MNAGQASEDTSQYSPGKFTKYAGSIGASQMEDTLRTKGKTMNSQGLTSIIKGLNNTAT